jgi:single-stranded DNA-binding protein
MAINNTVELIGNMNKNGVRIIESEESTFAVLSLATTDSYKEKESDEWKNKETIWHDLIAFSPSVIEILKGLNSKARVKITGTLSYKTFPVEIEVEENGQSITKVINKKETSIIVRRVEQAPLPKKK